MKQRKKEVSYKRKKFTKNTQTPKTYHLPIARTQKNTNFILLLETFASFRNGNFSGAFNFTRSKVGFNIYVYLYIYFIYLLTLFTSKSLETDFTSPRNSNFSGALTFEVNFMGRFVLVCIYIYFFNTYLFYLFALFTSRNLE